MVCVRRRANGVAASTRRCTSRCPMVYDRRPGLRETPLTAYEPLCAFLSFDEVEEFKLRAAARGLRANEVMRELALAFLRGEDSTATPAWRPPAEAADLAAAAAS